MINDQWLHDRLRSPVFASLAQMVEVGIPALGADAGAGRVYGGEAATAYVSAGRLGVPREYEPIIHDWPTQQRSVFARLREHREAQGVFRPHELLPPPDPNDAAQSQFGPIAARCGVVDALAVDLSAGPGPWGLLIFFRCGNSPPFSSDQTRRLESLREPLSASLHRACRPLPTASAIRPTRAPGHSAQDAVSGASTSAPAGLMASESEVGELVGRLSVTERRVLGYLCARYTERQIAETLGRSPHTIHVHVKNIYRKLAISSRKELLQLFDGHLEPVELIEPDAPREVVAVESASSGDEQSGLGRANLGDGDGMS